MLNVAYMLIMRDMNHADFDRYLQIDSSMQGGRDYELQYVCFVEKSSMQTVASAARRLIMLRQDEEVSTEDDQIYEEEIALVDTLKSLLVIHIPPPIVLASGRVTVVDKFQGAMHGTYLETGSSRALATACENTVASTTDLGVEFSLPHVQPSPFSNVLPHYDPGECPPAHDIDDDFGNLASAVLDGDISLCNTLGIPGMLHMIHNAANCLLSILVVLKWAIELLTEVSKLVRLTASCDRLCETCFSCGRGKLYQPALRGFDGQVYEGRRGSIAFCVQHILKIRRILTWGWR